VVLRVVRMLAAAGQKPVGPGERRQSCLQAELNVEP